MVAANNLIENLSATILTEKLWFLKWLRPSVSSILKSYIWGLQDYYDGSGLPFATTLEIERCSWIRPNHHVGVTFYRNRERI